MENLEHERDVEVGQDAGVEQEPAAGLQVQAEAGDLAAVDGEVVLAGEGGLDAELGQAGHDPLGVLGEQRPGVHLGRGPGGDGHAELAGAHDDGAAAGRPPRVPRPGAAAGVEVDLGLEVLVPADEGAVAPVGVEPQRRWPARIGVAGVAGQHRLVEGEAGGGLDAVVGQQPPLLVHGDTCTSDQASPSSPVQVREQQYS